MYISLDALIVLSQIIPVLLLASYLDRDVLAKISTYNKRTRLSWFLSTLLIVLGELVAVMAIIGNEPLDGIPGYIVLIGVLTALINLVNIAGWRVLGFDLASGLPVRKKPAKKNRAKM